MDDDEYALAYENQNYLFGCQKCPSNADCIEGDRPIDHFLPLPHTGYWIDRDAASKDPKYAKYVYACPRDTCNLPVETTTDDGDDVGTATLTSFDDDEAIVSGNDGIIGASQRRLSKRNALDQRKRRLIELEEAKCWTLVNLSSTECADDGLSCAVGSAGPMCGACSEGWAYSAAVRQCQECSDGEAKLASLALMLLMLVVASLVWSVRTGDIPLPKCLWGVIGEKKIRIGLIAAIYAIDHGALKLLWGTAQIIVSVSFNLDIRFPEPFATITELLSPVQLDFVNFDCLRANYYYGVYTASFFPLLLLGLIWAAYLLRLSYEVVAHFDAAHRQKLFGDHVYMSLILIYLVVPPVANIQFKALSCTTLADGSSYLRADTSVDCRSSDYKYFQMVDIGLICIYQSLPLIYMYMLVKVRDRLVPKASNVKQQLYLRDADESLHLVRFLVADYLPNR